MKSSLSTFLFILSLAILTTCLPSSKDKKYHKHLSFQKNYPENHLHSFARVHKNQSQDDDVETTYVSPKMQYMMELMEKDFERFTLPTNLQSIKNGKIECVDGFAAGYPCKNVDLLSFLSHEDMGSKTKRGNDIWGWEDPLTGKEYAIVAQTDGTAFVDISDPENPIFKGRLPTKTTSAIWRDVKVYKNHAFIVAESFRHGVQVFDLTTLRDAQKNAVEYHNKMVHKKKNNELILKETAYYGATGRCHNIAINEDSATAYCVGSRNVCRGGLYMIDISEPTSPKYAGCFPDDGYVHDAQCVNYQGPDSRYKNQEICFCFNEDTLTIVNVQNKTSPSILSRKGYKGASYTHQGWLTKNQDFLMMDDELDEVQANKRGQPGNTVTYIWDVKDLHNPIHTANYVSPVTSIDHNLYIKEDLAFLSNYASGLRILNISHIEQGEANEVGYFDVRPEDNQVAFQGTWSNYPYFKSGNIVVNSIERGLFVVRTKNLD